MLSIYQDFFLNAAFHQFIKFLLDNSEKLLIIFYSKLLWHSDFIYIFVVIKPLKMKINEHKSHC